MKLISSVNILIHSSRRLHIIDNEHVHLSLPRGPFGNFWTPRWCPDRLGRLQRLAPAHVVYADEQLCVCVRARARGSVCAWKVFAGVYVVREGEECVLVGKCVGVSVFICLFVCLFV